MRDLNTRPVPSLFPYQISNRENFYFRDHPTDINPNSLGYKKYWYDFQFPKIIEGHWVDDNGTWVYMSPKLYFYINYMRIPVDKGRILTPPRLRDIEWIIFTYLFGVIGFSGFEGDEDFTCNDLVGALDDGRKLTPIQKSKIPASTKKKNGKFKTYIDPWTYLTRHYLIDHKPEKPLGRPLYENYPKNAIILSSRDVGKSLSVFNGDFVHEWLTSGVHYVKNPPPGQESASRASLNAPLNFAMGSADSRQLQRSINNIRSFYDQMPGQYLFPNGDMWMGPFYKNVQGGWDVGNEVKHVVKFKDGTDDILGAKTQIVALTADKEAVVAGDRFRRIYVEECGFQANLLGVHSSNKDSLKSGGKPIGSAIFLGTGGQMEKVVGATKMYNNPTAYDIFAIPDYWKNTKNKRGLFISAIYRDEDYKDENGNTYIELADEEWKRKNRELRLTADSVSFDREVSFNPRSPDQILRPAGGSILPRLEANQRHQKLEDDGLFQQKAMIGSLVYSPDAPKGVVFRKDMERKLQPLLRWNVDEEKYDKEGAFIMYEQPIEPTPENLYWVLYDPASHPGKEGPSLHSILVYKGMYFGGAEESMYNTIVAEWLGRKEFLYENYEMAIKVARFFNAKIFPEVDTAGFVDWCTKEGYFFMLESDALNIEREINPKGSRNPYKVGVRWNKRKKDHALEKLRDWLMEPIETDLETGIPLFRTIDWIYSLRILDEIRNYDGESNYDHISSMLCLMILLYKLQDMDPVNLDEEEEENFWSQYDYRPEIVKAARRNGSTSGYARTRARILNY